MTKNPRVVRNWWIELEVDGRKQKIATGPRSSGGGFQIVIYQRSKGGIIQAMTVSGDINGKGELQLDATKNSEEEFSVITEP